MTDSLQKVLGKRVTRIYHNYIEKSLVIYFDDDIMFQFYECALVFDLGITGHIINYVSPTGTLGMSFELKKLKYNPDDYNCLILSRDINDFDNKNEIIISFKDLQCTSPN